MSSYQIVTRQQAAKFLAYVKGEATVQTNHLLFSVESSLSVQKDKILQNDLYFDEETGLMEEAVAKSYFEIEKNIAMCQILKLGLNSLPVSQVRPRKFSKQFSNRCKSLLKMFDVQESEAELMYAKNLLVKYPQENFWSQIIADNPEFKLKSFSYFSKESGARYLERHAKKYEP